MLHNYMYNLLSNLIESFNKAAFSVKSSNKRKNP